MKLIQGDGSAVQMKPTFLELYFTQEFNDPKQVFRQNIFAFDGTPVDAKIFGTKTCFVESEMSDKEIRLPIKFRTFQDNAKIKELKKALKDGLSAAGKVDLSRIQDIDMEYKMDSDNSGNLYVVFTVVEYPSNYLTKDELSAIGYDTLPDNVKRNLTQVLDNIGKAVASGNMNISIADPLGNGTLVNITADKNYYVTIAGRNSAHNYVPKNVDHGYSSGAMVGLAIISVLIGMGLVVGAFWISTWKRLRLGQNKTMPLRSVENPMTFSEMK